MNIHQLAHSKNTRSIRLAAQAIVSERRGGSVYLRSPQPLAEYPRAITDRLDYWAGVAPDRVFLAQRAAGSWRTLSYKDASLRARRVGAALLAKGLSVERPLAVLSGNDIEHALLELAAMYVGVPYAPVSPAYSLVSSDFAQLRRVIELITPGLVFVSAKDQYQRAMDATCRGIEVIDALPERDAEAEVDAANARVGPDTIAKFLFTSGSTGAPKAVINTQRMWCANQEMVRQTLTWVQDEPPLMVDWAPWHHTAGGNKDFGMVLYNGGTMYLDEGKPLPGAIEATVRNLREVAPNWYFTVPKGYEMLLPYLKNDLSLRKTFFSRLKALWFAGAGVRARPAARRCCSSPASAPPRPRRTRSAAPGTPTTPPTWACRLPGSRSSSCPWRASTRCGSRGRASLRATGDRRS
jgi:feruloyl-CoA synthase